LGNTITLTIKNEAQSFLEGTNFSSQKYLGIHEDEQDGKKGFTFRVWAPNALSVFLVGDFTNWWEHRIEMKQIDNTGIWEIFTSLPKLGELYKYQIKQANGQEVMKFDPFARKYENRPGEAAVVTGNLDYEWQDKDYFVNVKDSEKNIRKAMNNYELHAGKWRTHPEGTNYTFKELADELIPYILDMGYTHIEFMPLLEHPFGPTLGYQGMGYFATSSAFGSEEGLMYLVDKAHQNGIGVLMDFTPAFFSKNDGLFSYYDGTPQFEYKTRVRAKNKRWDARNFDVGKKEVQSFLISSALFWLKHFHLDGLRITALDSLLFRDQDGGAWTPNSDGGRDNYEGIAFLKKLNSAIAKAAPKAMMIGQNHTHGKRITGMIEHGGLGFDYKWNLSWTNDTLDLVEMDPIYRKFHFDLITYSFVNMFEEKYINTLSNADLWIESQSLVNRIFGTPAQKLSTMRLLSTYQMTFPGKKLSFMGNEWATDNLWTQEKSLSWQETRTEEEHVVFEHYTKAINHLYLTEPALWELDNVYGGIEIVDADNSDLSVFTYIRRAENPDDYLVIILNLTPVERPGFEVGVPNIGTYEEVFNTGVAEYGGEWTSGNKGLIHSENKPYKERYPATIKVDLPRLSAVILKPKETLSTLAREKVTEEIIDDIPLDVVKKKIFPNYVRMPNTEKRKTHPHRYYSLNRENYQLKNENFETKNKNKKED
jgi:1,4-alpha-glucan branching enzyme